MEQVEKRKLTAIIEHNCDEKYILVKTKRNDEEIISLVSLPFDYHSMIAEAFEERLNPEQEMYILGGGLLRIDRPAQKISTYGQSGSYGKPPVELVREVLETNFPDWTIDAKVTDCIRC